MIYNDRLDSPVGHFLSKYLLNSVSQGGALLCLSIGILRLFAYIYN